MMHRKQEIQGDVGSREDEFELPVLTTTSNAAFDAKDVCHDCVPRARETYSLLSSVSYWARPRDPIGVPRPNGWVCSVLYKLYVLCRCISR